MCIRDRSFSMAMSFSGRSAGEAPRCFSRIDSAYTENSHVVSSLPDISPEQDLAYKCLDVYMSVVSKLDRELMLRTLGRAWGLEEKTTTSEKSKLELLAVRAGHRLRRVLEISHTHHRTGADRHESSINVDNCVAEIHTRLPNKCYRRSSGGLSRGLGSEVLPSFMRDSSDDIVAVGAGGNNSDNISLREAVSSPQFEDPSVLIAAATHLSRDLDVVNTTSAPVIVDGETSGRRRSRGSVLESNHQPRPTRAHSLASTNNRYGKHLH
eukprot:TRINITY_DN26541_c0_g1_i1.p1 TRINITY_DN26541_c0_g1~~TRINITY_DN26541_c0_g1_i1.p1  ORF type:complete len:267 (+),score=24.21 TRINITY_DN26541_c0_g1_i1:122-922(+)